MGFSRQEYWNGLPCLPPRDLPDPMIESEPPAMAGRFFTTESPGRTNSACSVQFSCSVMSNSMRSHESQHARPPCPSPTPGGYLNSCPSSQCCHPIISRSVVPFSSCPLSFPTSGSFQMSQLFTSGGLSIGVSASTSVLPMNTQD